MHRKRAAGGVDVVPGGSQCAPWVADEQEVDPEDELGRKENNSCGPCRRTAQTGNGALNGFSNPEIHFSTFVLGARPLLGFL